MYATARDWAKFGQLFLNEGSWPNGSSYVQVVPASWVRYVQKPAKASKHTYGGQWWLNGMATEGLGEEPF